MSAGIPASMTCLAFHALSTIAARAAPWQDRHGPPGMVSRRCLTTVDDVIARARRVFPTGVRVDADSILAARPAEHDVRTAA